MGIEDEKIDQRITPACAGNSSPWGKTKAAPPDHPRVCGEQPMAVEHKPALLGSPPRVRGTAFRCI